MSTSRENQQTVEAALDNAGEPGVDFPSHIMDDARAALRSLVAQAELAADLGDALEREVAANHVEHRDVFGPDFESCQSYSCGYALALLARLDGVR